MAQNITTGVQYLENGHGFLSLNKAIVALVTGMQYSAKLNTDKILTAESAFFEGALPTTLSMDLSGDFISTSGVSYSIYSGYTGSTLIQAGSITGVTTGLNLFNAQLTRSLVYVQVKLAAGFVVRGYANIDSVDLKYKPSSFLTGTLKLSFATKPVYSAT